MRHTQQILTQYIETVDEVLVQEEDMIFSLKDIPKTSSGENQSGEEESTTIEEEQEQPSSIA